MSVFAEKQSEIRKRMLSECVDKFGNLCKASRALGKSYSYLYGDNKVNTVLTLIKICEALDLSLNYALYGGIKNSFKQENLDIFNISKYHAQHGKRKIIPSRLRFTISKIKDGSIKNISLRSWLELASCYNADPLDLLRGDF